MFQKIIQLLKKWFSIPKFVLLVVLFFLTLLIGVWNSLPFFLEWGVKGAAKDNGFPDFKMKVSQLDPWKTKILNLATGSDQNLLEISQIDILYDPASVALGEINAISLSGISAQVEIEENILNTKGSSNESSFTENFDLIQNFLSNPPLSYLRIRDSSITLLDNNKSRKVHFLAKIDFLENLTHFLWEADYNSTSITGEFNLSREENSTFASTQMEITDTAGLIGEVFSDERLSKVLPKQLKFSTGNKVGWIYPSGFRWI